jgi:DNA repair exonuclease SbcCD ATPase subunit
MGDRGYGHMLVVKSPQHQLYPPMRQLPSMSAFNSTLKTVQLLHGNYNMDFNAPLISTGLSNMVIDKQQQAIEILSATARSMAQGENGSSFTKGKITELREEMDRNKREHDKAIKVLQEAHAAALAKVKADFTYKELQVLAETETLKTQLLARPTQRAMVKQKELLDDKASETERLKAQVEQAKTQVEQAKTQLETEKKAAAKLTERLKTNATDMAGLRAQVAALSARLQEVNDIHEKKQAHMAKQLVTCKTTFEGDIDEIKHDHKTFLEKLQQEHAAAMHKQKADLAALQIAKPTADVATETDANDEEAVKRDAGATAKLRELEAYNHELRTANVSFMHHTRDLEGKMQAMYAQNQELKRAMESGGRYTKQAYAALQTEIDALRQANLALHKAYSTLTTMTKFGFLPNGTSVETAMEMVANLMTIQEDAGRLRTENERLEHELNKIKAIVFAT